MLLAGLLGWMLISGCDRPDQPDKMAETSEVEPLVLAVQPFDLPSSVQQHFAPLQSYLSDVLKRPVKLYIATSYEDQIQKILNNKADLAYMGPTIYVKTQKIQKRAQKPLKPIVTEHPYRGVVVVHEQSDIETLSQLRHKRLALGAYFSYAGHFAAREALNQAGVRLADLSLYSFLQRHHRAAMSVVYRHFDAAATTEGIARRMISQGHPLRIIHSTKPLAPIVLAANHHLSDALVETLQIALLNPNFDQELTLSLFSPQGYQAYQGQHYREVERVMTHFER
ncbi:PhnD/SsuA/transferrin family substrate-binding protein [Hydrogenovibrio halophilus]|uniref:PhnD/SsuA/transferrin family substrate-binding protein n=1 Tax=Hydrogenovibrio halophilus TaxID=373391 RepID=UPI0003A6DD72|nr:PhnD/SsuA/transferrin family substrate-binding protein [Hydrogenovibrio halophilus]